MQQESATIAAFDCATAGEDDLAAYHELAVAAAAVDRPEDPPLTPEATTGRLRTPLVGGPSRHLNWVARLSGRMVGMALLLLPELASSHLGGADVLVHPDVRRRGIGTDLLRVVVRACREQGRTAVNGSVIGGRTGEWWATALGLPEVNRHLHHLLVLADTDPGLWHVDTPPGYRLERWTGRAPQDLVASYAQARNAIHDAPAGDGTNHSPEWTVEAVRRTEADLRSKGIEARAAVAVHEATGAVAGLTELQVHPFRPDRAYQGDTAVLAAHRGHGLGRCVKAGMLRWLRAERPGVESVITVTAATNAHMIRVNHEVGFETIRSVVEFEDGAAALEARLAARP